MAKVEALQVGKDRYKIKSIQLCNIENVGTQINRVFILLNMVKIRSDICLKIHTVGFSHGHGLILLEHGLENI